MKNFLFIILFSFLLTSCSTWKRFYYDISMDSTEVNNKKMELNSKSQRLPYNVDEEDETGFLFEDDDIKITWKPNYDDFKFVLFNKTNSSIKLIWDECSFIDVDNKAFKVINKQTKLINEEKTIVNTIIPKGAAIDDLVYPVGWVKYNYKYGYSAMPMFDSLLVGGDNLIDKKTEKLKKTFLNKSMKVLLKFEINSEIKEYTFSFSIKNIEIKDYTK